MDYEKIFEDLRVRSIALLKRQEQLKWNPLSFFERLIVESELNECRYELLRFTCPKSYLPADVAFLKTLSLSDPPVPENHLRHKFCSCISDHERQINEDKMKILLDELSSTASSNSNQPEGVAPVVEIPTTEDVVEDEPLPDPSTDLSRFDEPAQVIESTIDDIDCSNGHIIQPQSIDDGCCMNLPTILVSHGSDVVNIHDGQAWPLCDTDITVTSNGSSNRKKNRKRHQKERARAYRSEKAAHLDWVNEVDASKPLDSETASSIVDTGAVAQPMAQIDFSKGHSDVKCLWGKIDDAKGRDCDRRIRFVDYAIRHLGVPDPPDGPHVLPLIVRLLID